MHKLLSFFSIVILALPTFAQVTHPCGTHHYDSVAIANDPSIIERRIELENFTQQYQNLKSLSTDTLIIPVVYHVLHQYGTERLNPNHIKSGVDKLNLAYIAQNNNLNTVVPEFKEIIGAAHVELRLAKLDPNGVPTTGIIYYDTPETVNATENIYGVVQNWDPSKYLNIWTVLSTESGAAAWSHYPGVTPSSDGIVSMHQFVNSNDHTIAHELGHYLNLPHPWGDSNEPGLEDNCDTDDGIDDTPNTIGIFGTCDTGQESCGSLDNIQNIMDYSSCPAMFTMGQVDRMRAALNSSVGDRNKLWTEANQIATGVHMDYVDPGSTPIADFKSAKITVCPGSSFDYEDFSYGGEATSLEWTFEGGTPSSSNEKNPSVSYATPGEYKVSLKVANNQGTNTLTREKHVRVTNTEKGIIAPTLVNMEDANFPTYDDNSELYWTFEEHGTNHWETHRANDNTALRINNEKIEDGIFNAFITSNINLVGMTNPDEITFEYAFAKRNETVAEQLKVYVSNNCGKKWALRANISGEKLVSNDGSIISDEFIPKNDEWTEAPINFEFNANDEFVMLKFEILSGGGNYLYIDNINIGGVTHNFTLNSLQNLRVFPNPASNNINITLNNHQGETSLLMINMLGQKIWNKNIKHIENSHTENISLKELELPSGVYFITVKSDIGQFTERVVVNP